MWNQVVLYPAGRPAKQIMLQPTLRLPSGWKFNTSLPVASRSGDTVTFAPVDLELLVDSPVQSAEYAKVIPLTTPGEKPPAELDVVADDGWALEIPEELIANYKRLVAEAQALYRSHHYRDYHFLLTLSDHVLPLGQNTTRAAMTEWVKKLCATPIAGCWRLSCFRTSTRTHGMASIAAPTGWRPLIFSNR